MDKIIRLPYDNYRITTKIGPNGIIFTPEKLHPNKNWYRFYYYKTHKIRIFDDLEKAKFFCYKKFTEEKLYWEKRLRDIDEFDDENLDYGKIKKAKYRSGYYQKNKEKLIERRKKYYIENKDLVSQKAKKFYQDNNKILRQKRKDRYWKNKEVLENF